MRKLLLKAAIMILFGLFLQNNVMAISLTYGDSYYLGHINDGIPSNPADEAEYINNLITLSGGQGDTVIGSETYDRISSTLVASFPEAVESGSVKDESMNNIFDATGFSYILGKYDAGNSGSFVWFLGDNFSGDVMLPSNDPIDGKYGLSHISAYNPGAAPVPEPATMLLLGAGLVGLAGFRRKIR